MSHHRLRLLLGLVLPLVALGADAPTVVLLRNGEVFQGQIESAGGEVRVVLPNGEVRFRVSDVECTAATVQELYLRKRAALLPGDPQEHLRLSQWCLRQGLFDEAAAEIAAARAIDPRNPAAELMARRLELGRQPSAPAKSAAAAVRVDTGLEKLDRLVQGMPEKSVETFTQRVQPALMNTCATPACHGPASDSKLQLLRAGGGRPASRRLTQRNLQALLPWIDQRDPAASELLKYACSMHAAGKAPPMSKESIQYRRLMEWVYQMARAEDCLPTAMPVARHPAEPAKAPPATGQEVQLTSGTEPARSGKVHREGVVHAAWPQESPAQAPPQAAPAVKPKPEEQAPASNDPFDPEVFNRRFHKR
jgi:hypothetical protein